MGCLWAAVARGGRTSWQFGYFDGDDGGGDDDASDGYGYSVVDDRRGARARFSRARVRAGPRR